MKLLCVSDIVTPELYDQFNPSRFGPVDLVIGCGDLPPEYLSFLVGALDAPVFYVRGNHDIRHATKPPTGCTDIHGRIVRHGALRIMGLEGSRWYNGGPAQYTEKQMRAVVRRLKPRLWWDGGVHLIVSHAPPRRIHDAEDPCHRGFKVYRRLIQKYAPDYFLHGHIHSHFTDEGQRITREGHTQVINCFGYYQVEIDDDRLDSRRKRLWRKPPLSVGVKSFNREQARQGAFDAVHRGTQRVPLEQIVGSVGRYKDFDGQFRPRQHVVTERYQKIKQALRDGRNLPPVKLYQIKNQYYALDGNHRIAAAKELRHDEIRASIVEFLSSADKLDTLLQDQRSHFSQVTGLPYAITLTEVGQYDLLLGQIQRHQSHLKQEDQSIPLREAALDWYDTIYRPLLGIIRKGDLIQRFPKRTLGDLYAYISYYQWERDRKRKYGIGVDRLIPNDMEVFRAKMEDIHQSDYPEMLREITAFVLMKVRGKSEQAIMEKLYKLKEVREIHSIHGEADILIKIVLTRDLISSDAEIISEFVHDQMRLIPGVVSTQTLIPGRSMIKT